MSSLFFCLFFFPSRPGLISVASFVMAFSAEELVAHPKMEQFCSCTKEQLISLASFLKVTVTKQMMRIDKCYGGLVIECP